MLRMLSLDAVRSRARNGIIYLQMFVLAFAGVAPLLNVGSVGAEQLTSRKVTIGSSKPTATTTYDFQFSWASSTAVNGVILQFCSEPLGTCLLPGASGSPGYSATGAEMNLAGATHVSDGFTGGVSTAVTTPTGACSDVGSPSTSTMLCFNNAAAGTAQVGTNVNFNLSNIVNPGLPNDPGALRSNKTIYVRVSLYTNNTFASTGGNPLLEGTVAASINQQLTVTGRVQEKLNFCVAAVNDSGATDDAELPGNVGVCATNTPGSIGSTIDLGVIDNTVIAKSPVENNPPGSLGNNSYGIAMLNTNASNGTAITYFAEEDTAPGATNQLRAFRVPGAACNALATTLTDQCFQSISSTGATMVIGTESFGMNIPCIIQNDGVTTLPASVSPTTGNLVADTAYNGDGTTTNAVDCEKSEAAATKYAWNTSSTAAPIATSTGSKVVDNEIVKLNFGATSGATTPTGSYTVVSTYIATPTF